MDNNQIIKSILKVSSLPKEFITDFYKIANIQYNPQKLIINLDVVTKWLDIRKDNLFDLEIIV